MEYPCGCVNEMNEELLVLQSISKCYYHQAHSGRGGLAHYIEMGCIVNQIPQHARLIAEMRTALGEMGEPLERGHEGMAVEVGSGLSMYAPWLLRMSYQYIGIEPDREAAQWVRSALDVDVQNTTLEDSHIVNGSVSLVVAAHVLEHATAPLEFLGKINTIMQPRGRLLLIVPDDLDPVNPDHLWFFTEESIRRTITKAGFQDVKSVVKRIVRHENFIYCSARKS